MRTALVVLALGVTVSLPSPADAKPRTDPYRATQWGLDQIGAPKAWRDSTGRGSVVAVLDTGVDLTHPDLLGQLVVLKGSDVADPDGCLDNHCVDDGPRDIVGHGTAMAGIIAARSANGIGVAGVAPNAKIMPVRVNSPHAFTPVTVARGVDFAVAHGAAVISMSLDFPELPYATGVSGQAALGVPGMDRLYSALDEAWRRGVVLIAAAGNGYPNAVDVNPATPAGVGKPECGAPALHPAVLCVGAVDRSGIKAYYSDFRATAYDRFLLGPSGDEVTDGPLPTAVAPCESRIATTYLRSASRSCPGSLAVGYSFLSGTSSATAYVAGVAALLVGGRTNAQVVDAMLRTATDLGPPGDDPVYGRGLVNASSAVQAVG